MELMEGGDAEGAWEKERFWTRQNFPGLPGFGTSERGEVWKGPRYLPLLNSLYSMSWKILWCVQMDGLLGGVNVDVRGGISTENPKCRPLCMFGYC